MHDCDLDNEEIVCRWCNQPARTRDTRRNCPASRGLGDTIAKVTSAIGIKPCGGCQQRQEALNKIVPYG